MESDIDIKKEKVPVWKTILKWVVCVVLLGYVAAALALGPAIRDAEACAGIDLRIEGSSLPDSILRQGVATQIAKYDTKIVGRPMQELDLQKMEDFLGRFSNFEDVECSFDPERRLRIDIFPIRPEARVFEPSGKSYYINREGKRIAADAEFFIDVPVLLLGKNPGVPPEHALPVIRRVTADKDLSVLVAAFKLDGRNDILLVPAIHGHVVNFGDTTGFERKKAALMTAYRRILPAKGWETYDTISVKFRDQVVASRRDKSMASHGPTEDDGEDLEEATLMTELDNQTTAQENG